MINQIPKDAVMLLSVINTKLRDVYPNLDRLCEDMKLSRSEIERKLAEIDYEYDEQTNQFV